MQQNSQIVVVDQISNKEVEKITISLVREYLLRKGYFETLTCLKKEIEKAEQETVTGTGIGNIAAIDAADVIDLYTSQHNLLEKDLKLEKLIKINKLLENPLRSMLEALVKHYYVQEEIYSNNSIKNEKKCIIIRQSARNNKTNTNPNPSYATSGGFGSSKLRLNNNKNLKSSSTISNNNKDQKDSLIISTKNKDTDLPIEDIQEIEEIDMTRDRNSQGKNKALNHTQPGIANITTENLISKDEEMKLIQNQQLLLSPVQHHESNHKPRLPIIVNKPQLLQNPTEKEEVDKVQVSLQKTKGILTSSSCNKTTKVCISNNILSFNQKHVGFSLENVSRIKSGKSTVQLTRHYTL